jgi:hypothetical protein
MEVFMDKSFLPLTYDDPLKLQKALIPVPKDITRDAGGTDTFFNSEI